MRYLVTGHQGYIGSDLTRKLLKLGHEVIGIDNGYFEDCKLLNTFRELDIVLIYLYSIKSVKSILSDQFL